MGFVAVVGAEASGITLRTYTDAGTLSWTAAHGGTLYAVAIDSDGNIIVGGVAGTDGYQVRKYSISGAVLWSYTHGATVYAVAIGESGAVWIAGEAGTDGYEVRRLSAAGALETSRVHGATVYSIAVSGYDVLFAGEAGNDGANYGTTRKYSVFGTFWSHSFTYDHGATVYGCMIQGNGFFTAGASSSGVTTRYHYADGTVAGSYNLGATARTICRGHATDSNTLYLLYGGASTGSLTTRRHAYYDSGSFAWSVNHGAIVYGAAVDSSGEFYTVGAEASGVALRKYAADGTVDTAWNQAHGATLYGVAWGSQDLGDLFTGKPPGLALDWALGLPTAFLDRSVPGLALDWALAAPTSVGALPPDGRLTPLPVLYRCYLSGPTDLEFPIISLQCTRRLGQSTWLVVEVMYNAERAAAIAARAGGQLIIYAGLRNALGQELLGEFARAWLTDVEATQEPGAGRLMLTGRLVPTPFTAQTRTLLKVTQRQVVDGRHEVRCCAVDPLLRPNDTVVDGAESWVAGTIHYRISAREAFMQVTEVSA